MSKIGRKAINLGNVKVEVKGQEVHYDGPMSKGSYSLPDVLKAVVKDEQLFLTPSAKKLRDINRIWGLHRALLANKIKGADKGFEKFIEITGLGYKASKAGSDLKFSLGYSHPISFSLPKNVTVDIDRSGQKLTFKSFDKELVGHVCSQIKQLKKTEPYKGTGIKLSTDTIKRKAGKTKAAA